jgi:hypothetical protein
VVIQDVHPTRVAKKPPEEVLKISESKSSKQD